MSAATGPAAPGRTWPAACPACTLSGQPPSWQCGEERPWYCLSEARQKQGNGQGGGGSPDSPTSSASPLHPKYSLGVVVAVLGVDIKLLALAGKPEPVMNTRRVPSGSQAGGTQDRPPAPRAALCPLPPVVQPWTRTSLIQQSPPGLLSSYTGCACPSGPPSWGSPRGRDPARLTLSTKQLATATGSLLQLSRSLRSWLWGGRSRAAIRPLTWAASVTSPAPPPHTEPTPAAVMRRGIWDFAACKGALPTNDTSTEKHPA